MLVILETAELIELVFCVVQLTATFAEQHCIDGSEPMQNDQA
jgi:hypothetical protein